MDDGVDEDCFVIPFQGGDLPEPTLPPLKPSLDFPRASETRYAAYQLVWDKLYSRSQQILREFGATLTEDLATFVGGAYDYGDWGPPPRISIPTAAIVGGSSSTSRLVEDVAKRCEGTYFSTIRARDCNNLTNTLKFLVQGFLGNPVPDEDEDEDGPIPGRSGGGGGPTLANYDLHLLDAWHEAKIPRQGNDRPKLVVFISEIESINPSILEDLFHICSLHTPQLSIVFFFGLATSVEYLHHSLNRSALKYLDVIPFKAAEGDALFLRVIEELFFNPDFEPGVMLGPDAMNLLSRTHRQQPTSVDAVLSTIQLLLLRHFSTPLSVLTTETTTLSPSEPFLKHVRAHASQALGKHIDDEFHHVILNIAQGSEEDLLPAIDILRELFLERTNAFRLVTGFAKFLHQLTRGGSMQADYAMIYEVLLEGEQDCETLIQGIGGRIKKRSVQELRTLLQEVTDHLTSVADDTSKYGIDTVLESIAELESQLEEEEVEKKQTAGSSSTQRLDLSNLDAMIVASGGRSRHGDDIADLFTTYLSQWLRPLDHLPLHSIWYIRADASRAVEEMLNPSILSAITSALIRPHSYLQCSCCEEVETSSEKMASFPDESIAFLRYLNSGKSVNVYDWFETFASALEGEEAYFADQDQPNGRSKGKKKGKEDAEDEAKRLNLQARFLRVFHEFDMIGLLKHSGRKTDHVGRTVYDITD